MYEKLKSHHTNTRP